MNARLRQVEQRPQEVRTPGPRYAGIDRLAVIRDDRLGDLVVTLPAVEALRRTYPQARLALIVRPGLAPLARMVPVADEVLEVSPDAAGRGAQLEKLDPDLVVCISRGADFARAARSAGISHRLGTGRRLYSPLFTERVVEPRRTGGRHEVEYALSFAHRAGAAGAPARFPLEIPPARRAECARWRREVGLDEAFVVLHPGSGGSCPRWPIEHYVRLGADLLAAGHAVVFTLGPEDAEIADGIANRPEIRRASRFCGDVTGLTALLEHARVVVSNSTGPLHLAAALDRPTLAFHAPWETCGTVRWGPYSGRGWVLEADRPGAADWSRRERQRSAGELMAGISPGLAREVIEELWAGRDPGQPFQRG